MKKEIMKALTKVGEFTKKNAPTILTTVGLIGFGITIAMTAKVAPKVKEKLDNMEKPEKTGNTIKDAANEVVAVTKEIAPDIAAPVAFGLISAGCIIASNRISVSRLTAAIAATGMLENRLKLKDKAIETLIGDDKKLKEKYDACKTESVKELMPIQGNLSIEGSGDYICLDMYSGRYFRIPSANAIDKAMNEANKMMFCDGFSSTVTLNDIWDLFGLSSKEVGDYLGWGLDTTGMIEYEIGCTMDDYGRMLYTLNYTRNPKWI